MIFGEEDLEDKNLSLLSDLKVLAKLLVDEKISISREIIPKETDINDILDNYLQGDIRFHIKEKNMRPQTPDINMEISLLDLAENFSYKPNPI